MPQTTIGSRRQSLLGAERVIDDDEITQVDDTEVSRLPANEVKPKLTCTCPEQTDDAAADHWGHCAHRKTSGPILVVAPPAPKRTHIEPQTRIGGVLNTPQGPVDATTRAKLPIRSETVAPEAQPARPPRSGDSHIDIDDEDLVANDFVGPIEVDVPIPPPGCVTKHARYLRVRKLKVGQSCWVASKKGGNIVRDAVKAIGGAYVTRRENKVDPKTGETRQGSRIWRIELKK